MDKLYALLSLGPVKTTLLKFVLFLIRKKILDYRAIIARDNAIELVSEGVDDERLDQADRTLSLNAKLILDHKLRNRKD
jgi:hypothetical protein